jgi:hypothetical protein
MSVQRGRKSLIEVGEPRAARIQPFCFGCLRRHSCLHSSYFEALSCWVVGSSQRDAAEEHDLPNLINSASV